MPLPASVTMAQLSPNRDQAVHLHNCSDKIESIFSVSTTYSGTFVATRCALTYLLSRIN
uniref:Uncharacterized protein n=1 Tax=Rhizophora mucronata TaxID=61149 RepID=A0A2P2P8U3_RHIMU